MADQSTLHARLLAVIDALEEAIYQHGGMPDALRAVVELHKPELFGGIWACLACSPGMPPPARPSASSPASWASTPRRTTVADQPTASRPEDRALTEQYEREKRATSQPECRDEYQRPGGRIPGDRIVRCGRPAGHDGEHEEADTEVTWPRAETPPPTVADQTGRQPNAALTDDEHQAMDLTVKLWNTLTRIVGDGPSRRADLWEFGIHIHGIQRAVMSQAAARAYPDRYRLLGEVIEGTQRA